jgi:hypothetical protein
VKIFVLFLMTCFMLGVWFANRPKKQPVWVLVGLCVFLIIAYYWLKQI